MERCLLLWLVASLSAASALTVFGARRWLVPWLAQLLDRPLIGEHLEGARDLLQGREDIRRGC